MVVVGNEGAQLESWGTVLEPVGHCPTATVLSHCLAHSQPNLRASKLKIKKKRERRKKGERLNRLILSVCDKEFLDKQTGFGA